MAWMHRKSQQDPEDMQAIKIRHMVLLAVLLVFGFLMVFPIIWMFLTSFRTKKDLLFNITTIWPQPWTLYGYQVAIEQAPLLRWFCNSLFITTVNTVVILFTSTLVGYVFAKFRFKYRNQLFYLMLATMMVPGQVTMIPRYIMILKMNLYDTLGALIIPSLVSTFGIYMCKQFIEDIPQSLCEAARIDGAGPIRIYFSVVLPNIRSAVASLAIFTALREWNDYMTPLLMLNDKNKMTLPLAMTLFTTDHGQDVPATMAIIAMVMIPLIILFILFQKQFIKGMTLSGMK